MIYSLLAFIYLIIMIPAIIMICLIVFYKYRTNYKIVNRKKEREMFFWLSWIITRIPSFAADFHK